MFESLHIRLSALEGTVDGIVGDIEKERIVSVSLNEVDGFSRESVCKIGCLLYGLTRAIDGVVCVVVGFSVTHVGGIDESPIR